MKNLFGLSIMIAVIFTACQSNETGNSKDVAQDQIYRHYEITFSEADYSASVDAGFRFAGDKGTTLVLSAPSKITANNVELVERTMLLGGAYYGEPYPIKCPDKKVIVTYTDSKENVLTETYEAGTIAFTEKPDTLYLGKNTSLWFSFSGVDKADNYEITLRDAKLQNISFYSRSATENVFEIPGTATDTLAKGEMLLQIISHKRKELDNHSTLGGTTDFSCLYTPVKVVAVKEEVN